MACKACHKSPKPPESHTYFVPGNFYKIKKNPYNEDDDYANHIFICAKVDFVGPSETSTDSEVTYSLISLRNGNRWTAPKADLALIGPGEKWTLVKREEVLK
jgi:hypothetical protein